MNMVKISNYQLFALIVLFQVGTTIIFGLASSAGRDAWIAVIISAIFGMAEIVLISLVDASASWTHAHGLVHSPFREMDWHAYCGGRSLCCFYTAQGGHCVIWVK